MNPTDFLESVLAGNPLTAPIVLIRKAVEGSRDATDKKKEEQKQQLPTGGGPRIPESSTQSTTPDLPTQQPIPPGGASGAALPAILEKIIALQAQEAAAAREFYPEKAQIDLETYRQQAEIAEQAGLEKMLRKTERDVQLGTIDAWQKVTQAQLNRDAMLGLGMMQIAYTSGMPNPNILQGAASLAGQGRSSFGTPISLIS